MSIYLLSPTDREDSIHLPVIEFKVLDIEVDVDKYDMLMFTSKQAVKSMEALNIRWKQIPCLAIGDATAKQIISLGGKVEHQPSSFYAKNLDDDIIHKYSDRKILYLRPKEVSFDSKASLDKAGLVLKEKIIYETICIKYEKKEKPSKHAIIIFTSPSTIHCFFKNFDWDDSYTAIVIGNASREHLPPNVRQHVADEPTIEACIAKAKDVLLNSNSK